jgi:hypothetical protein
MISMDVAAKSSAVTFGFPNAKPWLTALLPACAVADGPAADLVDGWRLDVFPGDLPDDLLIDALRREAARAGAGREVFLAMELASDWPRSIHRHYVKLLRDTHVTR